jgi:hypothetical protein
VIDFCVRGGLKLCQVKDFISLGVDDEDLVLLFKDKRNELIALLCDIVFLIFHEDI